MGNQLSRPFFSSELERLKKKYAFFFEFSASNRWTQFSFDRGTQFSFARFYVACFIMLDKKSDETGFDENWEAFLMEYVLKILNLRANFLELNRMLERNSSFFLSKNSLYNEAMARCRHENPGFQRCSPKIRPSSWSELELVDFFKYLDQVIGENLNSLYVDISIDINKVVEIDDLYGILQEARTWDIQSIMDSFMAMHISDIYQKISFPLMDQVGKPTGYFKAEAYIAMLQKVGEKASHAYYTDKQLREFQKNPLDRVSQGGFSFRRRSLLPPTTTGTTS
jgi:hypothetical protein